MEGEGFPCSPPRTPNPRWQPLPRSPPHLPPSLSLSPLHGSKFRRCWRRLGATKAGLGEAARNGAAGRTEATRTITTTTRTTIPITRLTTHTSTIRITTRRQRSSGGVAAPPTTTAATAVRKAVISSAVTTAPLPSTSSAGESPEQETPPQCPAPPLCQFVVTPDRHHLRRFLPVFSLCIDVVVPTPRHPSHSGSSRFSALCFPAMVPLDDLVPLLDARAEIRRHSGLTGSL